MGRKLSDVWWSGGADLGVSGVPYVAYPIVTMSKVMSLRYFMGYERRGCGGLSSAYQTQLGNNTTGASHDFRRSPSILLTPNADPKHADQHGRAVAITRRIDVV